MQKREEKDTRRAGEYWKTVRRTKGKKGKKKMTLKTRKGKKKS